MKKLEPRLRFMTKTNKQGTWTRAETVNAKKKLISIWCPGNNDISKAAALYDLDEKMNRYKEKLERKRKR